MKTLPTYLQKVVTENRQGVQEALRQLREAETRQVELNVGSQVVVIKRITGQSTEK